MNFNPDSYTLNEIANFFDLQPNHTFDQINTAFRKKHNEVTLSNNLSHEQKSEMTSFFEQLKNKLVLHLSTSDVPQNEFNRGSINNRLTEKIDDHVDTVTNNAIIYPTTTNKVISAGIMNPIERNILTNVIHFDTRFKQNYVIESTSNSCKNTKFTFNMPTSFKNVVSIRLHSCELPENIFNVTEQLGNNTFTLATGVGLGTETNLIIPEGEYDAAGIRTAVQTVLNDPGTPGTGGWTVDTVNNGFIRISHTGGIGTFELRFPEIRGKLNLGYLLGFRDENVKSSIRAGAANEDCSGTALPDWGFGSYYYLSFNDYQRSVNHNHFAILNKNFVTKNIIAKLKAGDSNTDYFITKKYFGPVTIDRVTFELLDQYGNALDLKGGNYSFSIEVDILYKY